MSASHLKAERGVITVDHLNNIEKYYKYLQRKVRFFMRKTVKLLSLVLAIMMLVAAFAACNSGSDKKEETTDAQTNSQNEETNDNGGDVTPETDAETADGTEEDSETEATLDIAKKNYNDDLYLLAYGSVANFYAKERDGNVVTEAVYDRQEKLAEHLGVNLIGTVAPGNHMEYHLTFTNSIKNKDGAVDFFIPNAYMAVPGIIESGYVRDLKTVTDLNLEASYWNADFMESIALFDHYFLGYSDFNIPNTYVYTFNKQMMERYDDALDESVYDMVYNYHWTIDKMISLVNLVYIDATGDGKTQDDTFGISGQQWIPFIPYYHASNMKLVEQGEDGQYRVSTYNGINAEKTATLVDKLKGMAESDSAWFQFRVEDTPVVSITSGRTLFYLSSTSDLNKFLDYDVEFGVLPYPMYDEYQKDAGYISLNYNGYLVFPSYVRNEQMIAESIEVLTFNSDNVRIAYYEKMLGKQVANAPDDAKMLDIVWDGLCSDFGLTYSTITSGLDQNLYMMPNLTQAHTTKNIASYVKGFESSSNKAISKFMKMIDNKMGS